MNSQKVQAILDKFPDGEKRFRESAIFNNTIMALSADQDPLKIIDQLINIISNTQNELKRVIEDNKPYNKVFITPDLKKDDFKS